LEVDGIWVLSSINKAANVSLNIVAFVSGSFTIKPIEDFRDIEAVGGQKNLQFFSFSISEIILADLRGPDGTLPDFGSIPSEPGLPPPALEREPEVPYSDPGTQTQPAPSRDQSTQVLSRSHQWSSATQTPALASTADQTTQVLLRPRQSVAYTQTTRPATSNTTSWTQTARPALYNTGTGMDQILTTSTGCQAGTFFDNEVIPPGVPHPKLPWAYTYAQFDALLTTYPDVHPEDFVTFGILQARPRRGSYAEWGEVASVLAHMAGGKSTLADELFLIIRRIQCLDQNDPMRAVEEWALVAVVTPERRPSGVPLGDGAYTTLAAPGGPLAQAAPLRDPRRRPGPSSSAPSPHRPTSPQPGPSGARGGPPRPPPGFVDLTEEDDNMDETPASPSPQVSDHSDATRTPMDTDDEDDLLAYRNNRDSDSDEDGFQHV